MMMRSSVVLCLAVSFAMFGYGVSLQCYSCPEGSSTKCEVKQECNADEDACLKFILGGKVYANCFWYSSCGFMTYTVPRVTYTCCQSDLCNS